MTVTVKINGSITKTYAFDKFPVDDQLRQLHFQGRYKSLRAFRLKIYNIMRKSEENRTDGGN